jgi:hypothetical protein
MAWKTHNVWVRWLVVYACAPKPINGRISLSEVGNDLDFLALSRVIVPAIVPQDADADWIDALWQQAPDDTTRTELVRFLEWLVHSDAESARRFVELTPTVLTNAEAWRATGVFATRYDAASQAERMRVAQQHIHDHLRPAPLAHDDTLTVSQTTAHGRISAMARAYFCRAAAPCSVIPRLAPLLIGPTGCGKSSLLRRIAKDHKAAFLRMSVGEWIPMGAKDVRPTVKTLVDMLAKSPNGLVLFIDELDKAGVDASGWTRSTLNEIFAVLDRSFPAAALEAANSSLGISGEEVEERIQQKLFFAGAGTWQRLWSNGVSLGFGAGSNKKTQVLDYIATEKVVPVELLMRFSWPPVLLEYPSPEETITLFDKTGLTRLAEYVGVTLDPAKHDWSRGGMRSLESLAGELLIRQHEQPTSSLHTNAL